MNGSQKKKKKDKKAGLITLALAHHQTIGAKSGVKNGNISRGRTNTGEGYSWWTLTVGSFRQVIMMKGKIRLLPGTKNAITPWSSFGDFYCRTHKYHSGQSAQKDFLYKKFLAHIALRKPRHIATFC
jgi:hypothetical protein